ncbi:MAG: hypothetical protein QM820_64545 [Minicystis sp.]
MARDEGWHQTGTATYSSNNQVVALTGGGYCGDTMAVDRTHLPLVYYGVQ